MRDRGAISTSSDHAGRSTARRLLIAGLTAGMLLALGPAAVDRALAVVGTGVTPTSESRVPAATADQGLTLVDGVHLLTRGHASIPPSLRRLGWVHVGDPDSRRGVVFDAYQGARQAASKAFAVTYANGRRLLLVHPLAPGESYHNSFVAVSPDGRWLVSGEWGTMRRLLIFAVPPPGRTATVQPLALAGAIGLRHAVRDVQGCDFSSPTLLLCSTDDVTTSLFPVTRQVLAMDLSHALNGTPVDAAVRLVASVPAQDVCAGPAGEVEGIDITRGVVRVSVNALCGAVTEVFAYPPDARWRPAGDIDVRTTWNGPPTLVDVLVQRRSVARPPSPSLLRSWR